MSKEKSVKIIVELPGWLNGVCLKKQAEQRKAGVKFYSKQKALLDYIDELVELNQSPNQSIIHARPFF